MGQLMTRMRPAAQEPEVDENIEPELVEPSAREDIADPSGDEDIAHSEAQDRTIQALMDELRDMRTRSLQSLMDDERFEPDLPDLNQRFEDIEWQIWHFYMRRGGCTDLQRWCNDQGLSAHGDEPDMIERLTRHKVQAEVRRLP